MKADSAAWIARANQLLSAERHSHDYGQASEMYQFATSMVASLYGAESPQMRALRASADAITKLKTGSLASWLSALGRGTIENAKAELEQGLIGSIKVYVAGEVMAELVRLGKETLEDRTEEAKNVSAVLIAAAFEGVLRKAGEELAGVSGRPKLEEVVSKLKAADVLKGGQVNTASGYLKFRNDSLHADFSNVDRSQVDGCLLFVESLLEKHFS